MKLSTTSAMMALALTATAAPLSSSSSAYSASSSSVAPSSFATGYSSIPYPTGTAYSTGSIPYATGLPSGVQPPYPYSTGSVSCPTNGALVCSSDGSEFGVCNWGRVTFQPVAAGTKCEGGKIVNGSQP